MVNYSSNYIKDYATLTATLHELTQKSVPFTWTTEHQTAFEQLKRALTQAPVMGYFDLSRDTYVTVDASPVGVSSILTQCESGADDHQVIAYASRSLSVTESRYLQTEKEALSIVTFSFMAKTSLWLRTIDPWTLYMGLCLQSHLLG